MTMKLNYKKAFAVLIAALIALSFFGISGSAESANEGTNYLTAKWKIYFPGTLTEVEEDGAIVTEYIPETTASWYSPVLGLFNDLKTMMGDKKGITVVISFDIMGVFRDQGSSTQPSMLIRAVNPRTGGISFPTDQTGEWDGSGGAWNDLYYDAAEGDVSFAVYGSNIFAHLDDNIIKISGDEWTHYETAPIYISANDLDETLFGDWYYCFDEMNYTKNFKGLRFRNTVLYNYDEIQPTAGPSAEPTEAPAQTTTQEPVKTDVPAATATEAVKTSDPDKNQPNQDNNKPGVGLVVGIVCGVAVLAAAAAIIVVTKRKNKK